MRARPRLEKSSLSTFINRLRAKSSFRDLSAETGISPSQLHSIEHGTAVIPEWPTKLADAFDSEWVLLKRRARQ